MSANQYNGEKVAILAEGQDTVMFLKSVCKFHGIIEPIYYVDFTLNRKPANALEDMLETVAKNWKLGLLRVGIVADAGSNREEQDQLLGQLTTKHSNSHCCIEYLLLPHQGEGGLENIVWDAIKPEKQTLKDCAESFLQCVGDPHSANLERHHKAMTHLFDKAQLLTEIYSMIAAGKKPHLSLEDFFLPRGMSQNRREFADDYIDFHHEAIMRVNTFFRNLLP